MQNALQSLFLFCWIPLSTAKLAAGQQKHLLFEVQPGSDASALWKVAVRILCTKVRPTFAHTSHAKKSICPQLLFSVRV